MFYCIFIVFYDKNDMSLKNRNSANMYAFVTYCSLLECALSPLSIDSHDMASNGAQHARRGRFFQQQQIDQK